MSLLDGATVQPFGEAALVLAWGQDIDPLVHDRVLAADRALATADVPGLDEVVPSYRSLLVRLDPMVTTPEEVLEHLARLAPAAAAGEPRTVEIAVQPAPGEDLDHVAAHAGTDAEGVLDLLTGRELRCYLHGFAPGFAYLGGLPAALHVPRRATPRPPVAPGSVMVAAGQAALCPVAMPTGWWVVGHTDAVLFDPLAQPPVPFGPGDRVRLVVAA